MNEIETVEQKFGVLNYVPVGFCLLRQDWVVLFWNNCLENWTKINRTDIVGTRLGDRFPHLEQPKYQLRLQQVFERGFPAIFSPQLHQAIIPSTLPNEQSRIQQTTVTAVPALQGTGFYALMAAQDVTELTHRIEIYQAELRERKRTEVELQRSNEELEQFAYVASHDLREPLRMVTTFTQMLAERYEGKLNEEADQIIRFAVDGASRMERLIHDLLAFSRVGRKEKQFDLADCQSVLEAALSNLQLLIQESNATIEVRSLPTVSADAAQLTQLFQNLVDNAIKYRSKQPPIVQIGAERQKKQWLFWVKDNGIGISPKHTDRIFMIFQRLHTRQQYSGTGIGLAMCKKIVERHGGRIWVKSEPGQGAIFYFTLPLEI